MKIIRAEYIKSSNKSEQCPAGDIPEYTFIGRSNVGKSSIINMLVNRKDLARTSSMPGKTQMINFFLIESQATRLNNIGTEQQRETWYITDLPGLGYAKISKEKKSAWDKMIFTYLRTRANLMNTFLLIDCRIPLQKVDSELIDRMGKNQLPFTIVMTKTDKVSTAELHKNILNLRLHMQNSWEEMPQIIRSSSVKGTGKEEILGLIEETNKLFYKTKNK